MNVLCKRQYSDSLCHSVKISKKILENVRELKVFGKESKLKLGLCRSYIKFGIGGICLSVSADDLLLSLL